jgi:hypothetical protein
LSGLIKPYSLEKPEPHIGLLPSGRSALAAIQKSYGLEGDSVEELEEERQPDEFAKPLPIEDPVDLYYLCEKSTPELVEAEMEQTWDLCMESQVYKTCLSIRRHVYTNTMRVSGTEKFQERGKDQGRCFFTRRETFHYQRIGGR